MRPTMALAVAAALLVGGCSGDDGDDGGACEKEYYGESWCHEFREASDCTGIGGDWYDGASCADIGYTKDCGDNVYEESWDACP